MSTAVFDRIALRYDELWTTTDIGRAQRNAVWREIEPLFQPGDRVLDIGCGTGEDAAHFTARGVSVHGIDPSPAMIAVARARGGFTTEVLDAESLSSLVGHGSGRAAGPFDGALSNFGALNCVEDLPAVARALSALMRPGARVAICIIGRFCAWETLYYTARFNFRKAFRRVSGAGLFWPESVERSLTVAARCEVYYPTVRQLRTAFSPAFELQRWSGIGMLVPPSYVKLPGSIVKLLSALDRLLARLPFVRALADHRLLIFVRK